MINYKIMLNLLMECADKKHGGIERDFTEEEKHALSLLDQMDYVLTWDLDYINKARNKKYKDQVEIRWPGYEFLNKLHEYIDWREGRTTPYNRYHGIADSPPNATAFGIQAYRELECWYKAYRDEEK